MLKRMGPKKIWVPKTNHNLFYRHKWEGTTLQAGQRTVMETEQRTVSSGFVDSEC